MTKTATAGQQARAKLRELRTRQAAEQAARDRRIEASIERLLTSQQQVAQASEALAAAQDRHAEAVDAAAAVAAQTVRALKEEDVSPADTAALTGLTVVEVRRALKADAGARQGPAGNPAANSSIAAAGG